MKDQKRIKTIKIREAIDRILAKMKDMEVSYSQELKQVHPIYKRSATNLIHYLALRTFNIDKLDEDLMRLGLPKISEFEGHIRHSILDLKHLINSLMGEFPEEPTPRSVSLIQSEKFIRKNTKLLFGYKSKKRKTRIMVTLPNTAADDLEFVRKLLRSGMNCARINCAHDEASIWLKMIENVKEARRLERNKCKITMDLGGPKLRTGPMTPGPKVVHIRPQRDDLGRVSTPAKLWIAPPDIPPPVNTDFQAFIPVDHILFSKIKTGNMIKFVDARGKNCRIVIDRKEGKGKWGVCSDSAYLETGTEMILHKKKQSGKTKHRVGELLPKEQFILLHTGDLLRLHKNAEPGENAKYDEDGKLLSIAHVSCSLPQIIDMVKEGEPIYFDDGKIEGIIKEVGPEELIIRIIQAKDRGSKLKADKGINLPLSDLRISGLTKKDRQDLRFVASHADTVNFSFVNSSADVEDLYSQLDDLNAHIGVILKIETQKGFENLPSILLTAMQSFPIGIMTARGDLAIETGWKNFATIQQEIMRLSTAAHIPNVWATQVLENLAKKGTPSRAEITDAALAQQAECVMLNKGYYIHKAVKMLDKILRRMQRFQRKSQLVLPRLEKADQLLVSHRPFDVN
ncbi:MAG: pyruvate kinase [Flavobacteriaceae bacterium]